MKINKIFYSLLNPNCYIAVFYAVLLLFIVVWPLLFSGCINSPTVDPNDLYKRFILDPIPQSVTNIKVDQPANTRGYRYVFNFNINRKDVTKIVNSRPFVRVHNVKFNQLGGDYMHWEFDFQHQVEFIIYHPKSEHIKPNWFKLELWQNPETYVFYKVGDKINTETYDYKSKAYDVKDTLILVYDELQNEAYCIVSRYR